MKRMLDDYKFDEHLRYDAHRMLYILPDCEQVVITGMLGAAVLAALLVDTDEGEARGIAVDSPAQRNDFFERYEREVRPDNGGLFTTELQALGQSYSELYRDKNWLPQICRNDRLYDLTLGLTIEYMQRLVNELVEDSIFAYHPWEATFAQWLYDAAFIETHRQRLLSVDWSDPAEVYQLNAQFESTDDNTPQEPTFFFEGISSADLLNSYFNWLQAGLHAQTSVMPDAKVQLAQLRPVVIEQETNWDFIRPQIDQLSQENRQLFYKWMDEWKTFLTHKMTDTAANTFPHTPKSSRGVKQVLFPDDVLECPKPNCYAATRDYIYERCRYDQTFKDYFEFQKRVDFCKQLSVLFGWDVDPNALGKRLNYKKKSLKFPKIS